MCLEKKKTVWEYQPSSTNCPQWTKEEQPGKVANTQWIWCAVKIFLQDCKEIIYCIWGERLHSGSFWASSNRLRHFLHYLQSGFYSKDTLFDEEFRSAIDRPMSGTVLYSPRPSVACSSLWSYIGFKHLAKNWLVLFTSTRFYIVALHRFESD